MSAALARRRILLVDDHPIVRLGLRELLDGDPQFSVCGEAATEQAALAILDHQRPDLVIVDLSLREGSGLSLIRRVRRRRLDLRLLVLSMHDDAAHVERALKAEADGYLAKDEAFERLLDAVRRILSGRGYLSPRFSFLLDAPTPGAERGARETRTRVDSLTGRELEVLELIGRGLSTAEVARHLVLSVKTIETYRANIKAKLGLSTSTELLRYALSWRNHDAHAESVDTLKGAPD